MAPYQSLNTTKARQNRLTTPQTAVGPGRKRDAEPDAVRGRFRDTTPGGPSGKPDGASNGGSVRKATIPRSPSLPTR